MQAENDEKLKLFCNRLKAAREALGLERVALASRWGFSENYVAMMESGKKPVPEKLEPKIVELELLAASGKTFRELTADVLMETGPMFAGSLPGHPTGYEAIPTESIQAAIATYANGLVQLAPRNRRGVFEVMQRMLTELINREPKG